MFISVIIILFFSCQDEIEKATSTNTKSVVQSRSTNPKTKQQKKPVSNQDNGTEKHPPIPADNPIWEWDAKNFVPDFANVFKNIRKIKNKNASCVLSRENIEVQARQRER